MDQALLQDATGTMALMQFEVLGEPRVKVERAVHTSTTTWSSSTSRTPTTTHLQALAREYGQHISRPGNGISHYIHMSASASPARRCSAPTPTPCRAGAWA